MGVELGYYCRRKLCPFSVNYRKEIFMIISGIKLPADHSKAELEAQIKKKSGKKADKYIIRKKSVDARFGKVSFVYTIEVAEKGFDFQKTKRLDVPKVEVSKRPVVVGSGPCGLFAAYILALAGARPILLERGEAVEDRKQTVDLFWHKSAFNPRSNVQFGEGGAGTFSDGKLTTRISDPLCAEVLNVFCECGADEEILYLAKPHLGTDNLIKIVKNLREKIISLGGEVHFNEQLTEIVAEKGKIVKAVGNAEYDTDTIVLAIGHSARDTFDMLYSKGVDMIAKAFSVGVRIEHPQIEVDRCQYGEYARLPQLGAADYNMSYHTESGRGVYTFCMCPGGTVVAAASEENSVVTNGMSFHARDGVNANSAFLVSVTPDDFGKNPLDGVAFQRKIERAAFDISADYKAPCQLVGDFLKGKNSSSFGSVSPSYLPGVTFAETDSYLPGFVCESMREALPAFSRKLKFFGMADAVMTGPETRSSSPVRICRDDKLQSNIAGLYPAGEGAGYAGGIMSAAVDGIKVALAVLSEI